MERCGRNMYQVNEGVQLKMFQNENQKQFTLQENIYIQ